VTRQHPCSTKVTEPTEVATGNLFPTRIPRHNEHGHEETRAPRAGCEPAGAMTITEGGDRKMSVAKRQGPRRRPSGKSIGLDQLRERFIKRAQFLARDDDFLQTIDGTRLAWSESYPDYPIQIHTVLPSHRAPYPDPLNGVFDEYVERVATRLHEKNPDPVALPAMLGQWSRLVETLAYLAFPLADFYAPPSFSLWGNNPRFPFIEACLQLDVAAVRALSREDIEPLIPVFQLGLLPIGGSDLPDEAQIWAIPVFPGMIDKDLEEAVPRLIDEIREKLGSQEMGRYVVSLFKCGLDDTEIANRLGLGVQTVRDITRPHRKLRKSIYS